MHSHLTMIKNRSARKAHETTWGSITLLLALLSGCVPYSEYPLTAPREQTLDRSIFGAWSWRGTNESVYLHIGRDEDSGLLRVVMLDFDRESNLEVSEFSGHTSLLEDRRYLNLRWNPPNRETSGYLFVKYTVSGDTLGISLLDRNTIETAIHNGELKGEIVKGRWVSSVTLTDIPENLRRFFGKHDDALFGEIKYLSKFGT